MPQLKSIKYLLIAVSCLSVTYGAVMSRIGDVEVIINESKWVCDKITCPPNTDYCRVTKEKPTADATQLTRTNTCYSRNDEVLNQVINYEPIGATESISVDIKASRRGITSNSNGASYYTNGGNYGSFISSGNSYVNTGVDMDDGAILDNINNINVQVQQQINDIDKTIQKQFNNFRW